MKHKTTKLDTFEEEIETKLNYEPLSKKNKKILENIFEKEKKSKNINIRISQYDLEKIKEQSVQQGLPYQTFITSILHRYISHQLVDENSVQKTLKMIQLKHYS